ncbi:putative DNA replication complex GINS protein PSF2 [Triangularia verruculosa]|uniref:DNA replication complex GINS protein PSF2 n=1 Tax=Triangularia verruculosa TaxID=2587418 RepID=A0AAN7AS79_9PEZI|nr:putative DNA replication complex GINS protein PSF2 [Triangularia verruculosa]
MALPLPLGLTHSEVAFLAEMELVTVVPRQRLESIDLLSGKTPPLRPPHRADLPLWLALLLKKQRRANIVPPPWLHPASLAEIVHRETKVHPQAFSEPMPTSSRARQSEPGFAGRIGGDGNGEEVTLSPPFQGNCTSSAPAGYLPYHWFEVAEALITHAGDDLGGNTSEIRGLLRDLVEVRAAKMRDSAETLGAEGQGGVVSLRGVGAMELAENRGFVLGVVDGVRKIGGAVETARREREEEMDLGGGDGDRGGYGGGGDSDDDMGI